MGNSQPANSHLKILVLCYEYPPVGGGGGRVARSLAEELVSRGHQVRVQTAGMRHLPARESAGGVEVYRTQSFRRREDSCGVPEMGLFVATSFLPTLRHLRDWKPDVMHAHFAMPTGALAWAAHKATGTPYVLTAHLGDVPGGVPAQTDRLFKWIDPAARRIWKDAAGLSAVSSFVQDLAQSAYGRPVERILNGIDLSDAPPHPPETVGDPVRLLFLGRFNAQKNAPFLIEALARLPRSAAWHLTMIGDGPDMAQVRAGIARHGLEERVTLRGWQQTAAVAGELAHTDVLCMPSTSEGMPLAAVEALKFGVALMTSDIPGVRDVISDGVNGLTTPPEDVAAYAERLGILLNDPARLLAMRRASWQRAREFELQSIATQYEGLLSSASRRASLPVTSVAKK